MRVSPATGGHDMEHEALGLPPPRQGYRTQFLCNTQGVEIDCEILTLRILCPLHAIFSPVCSVIALRNMFLN